MEPAERDLKIVEPDSSHIEPVISYQYKNIRKDIGIAAGVSRVAGAPGVALYSTVL